jgi:two-component system phosphate regulon sensor histidine kinase PhoR
MTRHGNGRNTAMEEGNACYIIIKRLLAPFTAVFWPVKIARHIWLAHRSRPYEKLRTTFGQLGLALVSGLSLEETLRNILDLAIELMQVDAATLCLPVEDGRSLFVHTLRGFRQEEKAGRILSLGYSFSGRVFSSGRPLSVYDVQAEPVLIYRDAVAAEELHGYLGVPLRLAGEVKGVLDVWLRRPHLFSQVEAELLTSFANQAAVAIERVQLFAELRQRLRELTVLAAVSRALVSIANLDKALNAIAEQIVDILDVDYAWLFLIDRQRGVATLKAMAASRPERESGQELSFPLDKLSLFRAILETGEPVILRDATDFLLVETVAGQLRRPIGSLLAVPLLQNGQIVGILSMSCGAYDEQCFNSSHIRLAQAIAGQIALGLEKAQADARVEEERRKLDAVLSSIGDAVMATDRERRIVLCNMAAVRILGRPSQEIIAGGYCLALNCPGRRNGASCAEDCFITQSLNLPKGMATERREMTIVRPDGREVPISITAAPLVDEQGQVQGAVIAFRDITHDREVERLKSEFISLVSHELRTPLTKISLAAQLNLRRRLPPEEQVTNLQIIEEQAERLSLFVENIMNVTRLDSGQFDLDLRALEPHRLIEQARSLCDRVANSHPTEIKCADGLKILGDETKLLVVLKNLLDNAYKYSTPASPVRVEVAPRGETEVIVQVINYGPGFPPEEGERIFDKFYRYRPQEQDYPGYGLGLYLVKMLVEAQGGQVWATSRPEDETCFSFVLPRSLEENQ